MTLFSLTEVTDGLTQAEAVNYWQEEPCEWSMNGGKLTLAQLTFPVLLKGRVCVLSRYEGNAHFVQNATRKWHLFEQTKRFTIRKKLVWIEQQCQHVLLTSWKPMLLQYFCQDLWKKSEYSEKGEESEAGLTAEQPEAKWRAPSENMIQLQYMPSHSVASFFQRTTAGLCDTWYHTDDHSVKKKKKDFISVSSLNTFNELFQYMS